MQSESSNLKLRMWWAGPAIVYLGSLASLTLNRAAGQIADTFISYIALQALVFAIPLSVIIFCVKALENTSFWSSTGFGKTSWKRIALYTLILNFLSFLLSASLFSAGEYLTPRLPEGARYDPGAVHTAFQGLPRAAYWYMIFTSVVYAGFGEEVTFRGYILTRLLRKGQVFAIITSALMWSSLHLWYLPTLGSTGIWQHIDVFLTGILFGVVYVKARSILPLIIVHGFADILLPLSFLYPDGAVDTGAFIVLILGLLTTAGFTIYWLYRRFVRPHSLA